MQLHGTAVKRLNRTWRRRTVHRVGLLLVDVESPFNVGAIVRTAAVLGVDDLYLAGRTAPVAHPKAQKLAMGTDRYLSSSVTGTAADALAAAVDDGYLTVGLELDDRALPIHELDLARDVCIVVGHENRGLSRDTAGRCGALGYIPQIGKVGSLNVAAAVTIAAYETRRQGW